MAVWKTKSGLTFNDSKGAANWWNANIGGNRQISDYTYGGKTYIRPDHDMVSLTDKEIGKLIEATVDKKRPLTKAEVASFAGDRSRSDTKWAYYNWLIDQNADQFGFDSSAYVNFKTGENGEIDVASFNKAQANKAVPDTSGEITPTDTAFNDYYNNIYSMNQGTQGREMYDRLVAAEQNRALSEYNMADAMQQNQAMQQAQTIKAITDQVRAERMARLRAGMSEAQIANQDMQMMMTNVNALNQQTQEMNMARLQAQYAYDNAQDTAYQQYLDQANARGQIGSAMYAADAGNLNFQVEQSLRKKYPYQKTFTKAQYDNEQKLFSGQSGT